MNTNIEELYKKKYLKYKAKYLNIQRGGAYLNGVNDPNYQKIRTDPIELTIFLVNEKYIKEFTPEKMALDADGNIVVTDEGNNCLHVFDQRTGNPIRTIGSKGSGNGKFFKPKGIAFDGKGNIVVADSGNNRVQVLKYNDGKHVITIGNLNNPCSVAINTKENVVLVHCNSIIKVYNLSNGNFVRDICTEGINPGQLKGGGSIIFDRMGNIVVADEGNNRVQILEYATGLHIRTIGGIIPKRLYPRGIALDAKGNIIVTCSVNKKMYIYKYETGEYRFAFDGKSKMDNEDFLYPSGVVIDNNGSIIVSDRNRKIMRRFIVGKNLIIPTDIARSS
jgi:DNA-binding beta-propeller fold protein YncE